MLVAHEQSELAAWRGCVVVPTMGALHRGHGALIGRAREVAAERGRRGVVVTIFVNPTQFNDPSDFARYPRTMHADLEAAERAGADAVFAPSVQEVYPDGPDGDDPGGGFALPEEATRPGLEDAHRPGHFAGVCRVVRRLFSMTHAAEAVFGEKDWQQLQVVRALAARERLEVEVIPHATVRESDGLAMSSRNALLTAEDRRRAAAISQALCDAAAERSAEGAEELMRSRLERAGLTVEYAVVRDAATLLAPSSGRPMRALIAARAPESGVRLIDNAAWGG